MQSGIEPKRRKRNIFMKVQNAHIPQEEKDSSYNKCPAMNSPGPRMQSAIRSLPSVENSHTTNSFETVVQGNEWFIVIRPHRHSGSDKTIRMGVKNKYSISLRMRTMAQIVYP